MNKSTFERDFFPLVQYKDYSFNEGIIRETADFLEKEPAEILARFQRGFRTQGESLPEKPTAAQIETYYRVSSEELIRQMWAVAWENHRRPALGRVMAACPPGARLLDWGGGVGWDSLILRKKGFDVSYLEPPGILFNFAAFRFDCRELKIPVYTPDNCPPGVFQVVFAHAVLEHLPNPLTALAGMYAALQAGGRLFLLNGFDDQDTKLHLGAAYGATIHQDAEKMGFQVEYRDEKNGVMTLRRR